ncbi:MAG: hypothetical protein WCA20_37000 [Candidatus Sulfotelmatobacter sp.]
MLNLKVWMSSLLVLAITALPVMAGSNDAKTAKESSTNASAEATPAAASPNLTATPGEANVMALLGVLVMKGVLAPNEANAIRDAAPNAQFQALVEALSRKGIVSAADLSAAASPAAQPSAPAAAPVEARESVSSSQAGPEASPQAQTQQKPQPPYPSRVAGEVKPPPPSVPPAVSPVRVFPVDAPKSGALAGIKAGPITLAPYGFIKATVVHDSSDPDGDDFPFPGIWLNAGGNSTFNTGPTEDPEVHVKARSTRFGLNLEWPDMSKNLTLTGKIEGDFEGNFTEVDNADVSSIRNPQPRLRLANVRLDYHASDNADIFFLGGQDWTLFGSGALMNIVETTFNGAFWGNVWERSPQLRVGFIQTLEKEHHVNLEGQFGVMMPSTGQILKLGSVGLAGQLGQGEREGADADRPEWEGRAALSYQIDKATGVAPAQIALAGFHSRRTSIVPNSSYAFADCGTANANVLDCSLQSAFPNGFQASSTQWGGQIVAQLPTRWFTLVATAYRGGDLRFYFGDQLNTYATDTGGLTAVSGSYVTADGGPLAAAGSAVLGCTAALVAGACPTGNAVVAPQRPIRAFGGFVQLGLPLSRWFNADPKGHNAGWQLHFTLGKDQVNDRDLNNPGFTSNANIVAPLPLLMGKSAIATLYYKLNTWATFAFEQSIYATRAEDHIPLYTIEGVGSNEWQDHRTEFGPIFTF